MKRQGEKTTGLARIQYANYSIRMEFELIIARYDEDLSWLRRVPNTFHITVYNKGQALSSLNHQSLTITALPNIGHEDQTYLHHLVTRYDDLADVMVFCQGKPFDHAPDFHRTLKRMIDRRLQVPDFLWLGFVIDRDNLDGARLFQKWHPDRKLFMQKFWNQVFPGKSIQRSERDVPSFFLFYPGAQFIVTAEQIRKQPKAFYESAKHVSETLPDAGHCFERCWDRFFGINGIPPLYREKKYPLYLRPIRKLGITWDDVPPEARPWIH